MKLLLLAGTAVVAAGVAGGAFVLRDGPPAGRDPGPPLPTVAVERTDLAERTRLDGTLGYARSYTINASGQGVLTSVPRAGQVISRGGRAYGVDGHAVPLLYGPTPFWRPLTSGMTDGRDVLALERNLRALGHGDGLTVDRHFNAATRAAVEDWQDDLGVTETGTVEPSDVVVQPGALRVTTVSGIPGTPLHGTVFRASSTERQVTVELRVGQQGLARPGAPVEVELPGGKTAKGKVSSIGSVASSETGDQNSQPGQQTEAATLTVYLSLDRPTAVAGLAAAPVTVSFVSRDHKGVLVVPVNALIAVSDTAYAVSVVDEAGRRTRVPVELGFFADGKVEVTGALDEGTKVEVPRS